VKGPDTTIVYSNDKAFTDLLTGALSINKAILTAKLKVCFSPPWRHHSARAHAHPHLHRRFLSCSFALTRKAVPTVPACLLTLQS
jgi:hypothetical protein